MKYFGKKAEVGRESITFKALDSTMKAMIGNFKDTQLGVGSKSRKLDLRVRDLDGHNMVLG